MTLLLPKQSRIRDKKHRVFIASLPCCVSGIQGMTQAAHVSRGRCSTGMKASDEFCVPLSITEHAKQHEIGELKYWYPYGGYEVAQVLGKRLYAISGDTDGALLLIAKFMRAR